MHPTAASKDRCTGCRPPLKYLKAWPDSAEALTPRLRVATVDEDLPPSRDTRKSWYLALTQDPDLATAWGPVRGLPATGTTVLLFEDDVVALVQYLIGEGVVRHARGRTVNEAAAVFEWARRQVKARRKATTKKAHKKELTDDPRSRLRQEIDVSRRRGRRTDVGHPAD